jgi:hypothetical protein
MATSELAAWTLANDGVTTCDVIQHHDKTFVGINRFDGDSFEVMRDSLVVCKINLRSIATRIMESLEGRVDYNLPTPDAKVHRIGRLPPKLASAPVYLCVRCDEDSLLAAASSVAGSTFAVILVPTLHNTQIEVDDLAVRFKTIVVALDELIVDCEGRWHCQLEMLDEMRNRLGIGDTANVNSFRLEGENYQIRFSGLQFSLSNSVGLWYLREFLSHPNQVFDPVELEAARTGVRGRSSNSSTGESFDADAKRAYARKLAGIDEDLEEAAEFGDLASIERLQSEREKLIDYLSKATGKGGKARIATDASRARKNIRQQVSRDVDRISKICPELGEHLRVAFQGDSLCYRPTSDPGWQF